MKPQIRQSDLDVFTHTCTYSRKCLSDAQIKLASIRNFGTYRISEQRSFRRVCAYALTRQNLRFSHVWSMAVDEGSEHDLDLQLRLIHPRGRLPNLRHLRICDKFRNIVHGPKCRFLQTNFQNRAIIRLICYKLRIYVLEFELKLEFFSVTRSCAKKPTCFNSRSEMDHEWTGTKDVGSYNPGL